MLDQTHWLVPALTAALGGTLLLALVYYYLYARYRQRYLGVWSVAWSVYALRFVAELIETLTGVSSGLAVASQSVTLFSSILLLSGTYGFLSKPLPRAWLAAGALGLLWVLTATRLEADFLLLTAPAAMVTAAGYLWTGWVILHSRMIESTGKHLAGWAFGAWAVVKLNYPVFGQMELWAEWGFLATAVLEICVAVGFLLMYFESSRAELAKSEDRLRQVIQHMPVMLNAFDEKMNFVAWNRECERVTGYGSTEIINNPRALEMLYPDPEKRAKMLSEMEISGLNFRNLEWDLTSKSGEVRTVSWSNIAGELPIPGWHGWAVGVDITERKRFEGALYHSEQAALKSAMEEAVMAKIGRIIGSTLTVEDVYDRFSEEARKIIAFDRITITRILPETASVQILYTSGPEVPERRPETQYPLAGTISERVLATKKGAAFSPGTEAELTRSFPTILPMWNAGFRSFLLVPLISRDNVVGTLVLSSYAAGRYAPDEVVLAENIAAHISGAIANARMFAEQERMSEALRESEASLKSIFRAAPIGIGLVHDRVITHVNDRICEMLGYAAEELEGQSARVFYPTDEDFEFVGREKYWQIRDHGTGAVEARWQRKDGGIIDVLLSSTPLDPSDWSKGVTFTALDITGRKQAEQERRRLEDRLRQAQKMEAIGTLAGGIAHDFNNILAAVIGFAELTKLAAQGNGEATANVSEVLRASFRARDLVRQILTFSRQTEAEFGPVQIQLIVKEALKLLRASLPSTIQVRQDLACAGLALGDATQIHQVVMNLCTNSYQAMHEKGGVLEVSLSEVRISAAPPPELRHLAPGPCLRLRVRDSGPGIDPAIIHRIFDPYFTTKEKGKGTGLGLAVVHGIVKSHRGAIQVASRLGEGATFDAFFPMVQAAAAAEADPEAVLVGGRERILFVDDEPSIEILGKKVIGSLGYEVVTRGTAGAALELFRSDPSAFDLIISDMTMPLMTGDRMALEMMALRPDLPVIICTGFNELLTPERAKEIGIRALLMKPFLKSEAAKLIRQVLDQK